MPTDMQFMNVLFHDALRRDLRRVSDALSAPASLDRERRVAVVEHLILMLDLLHHHHTSEDSGLWPLVRERAPQLGLQMDAMEAEHATIAPAIESVRKAAATYSSDGGDVARAELLQTIRDLEKRLLPHLHHEETEVMPRVMEALTSKDWSALARKELRSGSVATAGMGLVWTVDGLDRERRAKFNHQVPALFRWLIDKRYGRAYRRRAARAFGAT